MPTPETKARRPRMADLARIAADRETARDAEKAERRRPLRRLADQARDAQRRVLQERGWPSR